MHRGPGRQQLGRGVRLGKAGPARWLPALEDLVGGFGPDERPGFLVYDTVAALQQALDETD
jgi:hypothetical protein